MPDPELWRSRGINYLSHLISDGDLKVFDRLRDEYGLPSQMFSRYLQLRHAFRTQFPTGPPLLEVNPFIAVICSLDPKKLISTFYNMLLMLSASRSAFALKTRWQEDIGVIEDEECSKALDHCKLVSPKLSDRLTQIYITDWAYLTPLRVSRYKQDQTANCAMCNQVTGTFYHLILDCPRIQGFFTQIVQFLHDTMHPKPCLLGIYPEPDINKFTKIFLHERLFSTRKIIAKQWMKPTPLSLTCGWWR